MSLSVAQLERVWYFQIVSLRLQHVSKPLDDTLWEELKAMALTHSRERSANGFSLLNLISLVSMLLEDKKDEILEEILEGMTTHSSEDVASLAILARQGLEGCRGTSVNRMAEDIRSSLSRYRDGDSN